MKFLIARVGHVAPQVDVHATATQSWPGRTQGNGVFRSHSRYTLGAHHPNRIASQQVLILIDLLRKITGEVADAIKKTQRRLQRDSAHAEVRGHHALPADHLENLQYLFALTEA